MYTRKKKLVRWLLWSFAGFFLLSGLGLVILHIYIPYIIQNKITQMVVEGSDGLYTCTVAKVKVNFWLTNIRFTDVKITIDSSIYHQQKEAGTLPHITYNLSIISGSISGIEMIPILRSKNIKLGSVQINEADIIINNQPDTKPNIKLNEKSLYNLVKTNIKGIFIHDIQFNKLKLYYSHSTHKTSYTCSFDNGIITLNDIRLDSIGVGSVSRTFFTENISLQLYNVDYVNKNSLYRMRMKSISYSTLSNELLCHQFNLLPTLSYIAYTKRHGMQLDIVEVTIPILAASHFQIENIFRQGELKVEEIHIHEPVLKIFRDKTAPSDTTSQLGLYPNELLLNTKLQISIPLINIHNATIHYIERQKSNLKTGDIFFTHVTGTFTNITNRKKEIALNPYCNMKLNGYFLHSGKLEVRFNFDLSSSAGNYDGYANLGKVNLDEMNRVMIPLANIRLKSMQLKEAHGTLHGNHKGVNGNISISYSDLNIELLPTHSKKGKIKKQRFASFFVNMFAIRKQNPRGNREVMARNIYVHRKREQPFAHLIFEFIFESTKKIILKTNGKNLKLDM